MDASGADRRILLVQTNQVLYVDKSVAGYKVKDALEKGDISQIGVEIGVNTNSERIIDLLCRFSFLVPRSSFLVSHFSVAVPVRFIVLAKINKIIAPGADGCFRLLARLPEE